MLESIYITLTLITFLLFISHFFVKKPGGQMMILGFSLAFFGALAMASAQIEVVHCYYQVDNSTTQGDTITYGTSQQCQTQGFFYDYMMYMFAFFCLFNGALFLIKSFEFFDGVRGFR